MDLSKWIRGIHCELKNPNSKQLIIFLPLLQSYPIISVYYLQPSPASVVQTRRPSSYLVTNILFIICSTTNIPLWKYSMRQPSGMASNYGYALGVAYRRGCKITNKALEDIKYTS